MRAWTIFAGIMAVLLTALVIVPGMNDYSMWHDEVDAFNGGYSLNSPADLYDIEDEAARIVHPPLFFIILKGWMVVTGETDFGLRTLTLLFTLLAVAFMFRLMVDMTGRVLGGVAAAAILGCMGYISYYTRTMHNHSLLVLTVVMVVFFYMRWWKQQSPYFQIIQKTDGSRTVPTQSVGTYGNTSTNKSKIVITIGLVLSTAAVMYTHYFGVFSILALNVFAVYLAWGHINRFVAWVKTQFMAFVLYIPWLPGLYIVMSNEFWESGESGGVESTYVKNVDLISDIIKRQYYEGFVFYVVLFVVGLIGLVVFQDGSSRARHVVPLQKRGKQLLFPIAFFMLTLVFAALANAAIPIATSRRLIALLIPVAMLLGYMIATMPRSAGWGVLAVFLILTPNEPRDPNWYRLTGNLFYRQAFEYVIEHGQSDDVLYVGFGDWLNVPPMEHYAERLLPDDMYFLLRDAYFPDIVNVMWARERLWLIWVDGAPTTSWNPPLDQKTFMEISHTDYGELNVTLYEMSFPEWELPQGTVDLNVSQELGGQFALDGAFISDETFKAGDTLDLWLDWSVNERIWQELAVFVHFVGENGEIWGQADSTPSHRGLMLEPMFWPVDTLIHDHYSLVIDADAPAGEYEVRIGIYDRVTMSRLMTADGDDGVVVARVVVE